MKESADLTKFKQRLHRNLKHVAPIFAKASIGDFSKDVPIPEKDDELTVFFVGVQIILDAIREKVAESDSRLIRLNTVNEELEHDKAVYRAILNSIAEGLVAVDKDQRITLINQPAVRMLGLDPQLVVGANYYDIVITRDRDGKVVPLSKRPLNHAISSGTQQITGMADGLQYVKQDGTTLPVAITASPVTLGDEIIGGVSTFRDTSEEMLLDRSKTEIISIASHQLRTPLTAIKWLSEQLIAPVAKLSLLKQRRKLRQIHESNERMISLVNDLLNVSRIDLGKLSISQKPFDITDMINDILRDISEQIHLKHLKVTKHIDPALGTIITDPRHVQVALQNIIGNAVKYSFAKKPIIISAKLQGSELLVTVADKGCGIPAAQQKQIFNKLFRADNARQMASEGSGLGLYVAKAMIEQLGGNIRFDSTENHGSTFYLTIPLQDTVK